MPDSSPEDVVDQSSVSGTPTDTTAQSTTDSDASTSATSSSAEKPAETLLDRVKATLKKGQEGSPSSETPDVAAKAGTPSTAKAEGSEHELPADEVTSPKTKERFGKLLSDLKTAKGEAEQLRPKAAEYDKIDTFIRNAGLSSQDVGSTLQIAAMLRSDPRAARERLQPIMAELDRILGETLPAELQARVDQGLLTVEDAKALNRASADAKLARQQAESVSTRQQQETQAREQQTAIDSTLSAIDAWEKQKAKGDPDWHQKQPEISEQVELAIERKTRELKRPYWPTPEEAVKLSESAAAEVEKRFKRFSPKPRAIDPPVTPGASPRSTAAPKNTLDIIKRVTQGGS